MIKPEDFQFFDFDSLSYSNSIDHFFPLWQKQAKETIVILSPHDDDAMLGTGYMIGAALAHGAVVKVIIMHSGNAGYSDPNLKSSIVEIRKEETYKAYEVLGLHQEDILRLEIPDFSGNAYIGWWHPTSNKEPDDLGSFPLIVKQLRAWNTTRLFFSNGYREHLDHTAVYDTGMYYGPQVGDPVCVDLHTPHFIQGYYQYSVWSQFDPLERARRTHQTMIDTTPADKGILVNNKVEAQIREGIRQWKSQAQIIAGIMKTREKRIYEQKYLELYMSMNPRPQLNYDPYKKIIKKIQQSSQK